MYGKEFIKSQIPEIPQLPGVYRMLDEQDKILYIGKAKNLQKRVSQYTLKLSNKNETMISLTCKLAYSVTKTESEALMLEGRMIKRFKPRFNILLKDDKSFPYIKLRTDTNFPQLLKYRGKELEKGKFFGPFASVKHVDITLNELQKIFRLRSCSDSYFESRTRPCMQYQIKKCYAPCVGKIAKREYKELTKQVESFFAGKSAELQDELAKQMEELSEEMKFEEAAAIRDRIRALSYVQLKSGVDAKTLSDADILALAEKNGEFAVQLFMYRQSQPCGNNPYFPAHTDEATAAEVMESFIIQFYQTKKPPKQILLSHDVPDPALLAEFLHEMHGRKVKITIPKLGERKELMSIAVQNAELALEKHMKNSAKNAASLKAVAELFQLETTPDRIEIYDNSHIQGAHAIGAMVVAGRDGFDKKEYRLFNIKEGSKASFGGDDYAMLREVLTRRLTRLKKEPERTPGLMIIDGGKGHLSTVQAVMDELDIHIPFVCMSKGEERNAGREQFHRPGHKPFTLDKKMPVMKYLQILRDEVHNFAIKSHRNKRSVALRVSSLDEVTGIGAARKKALLNFFGSFKAIVDATPADIAKVPGISKTLAQQIFDSIHDT